MALIDFALSLSPSTELKNNDYLIRVSLWNSQVHVELFSLILWTLNSSYPKRNKVQFKSQSVNLNVLFTLYKIYMQLLGGVWRILRYWNDDTQTFW